MKIGVDVQSVMRLPRCGIHHHTYEILLGVSRQRPGDRFFLFFDENLLDDPLLDRRFLDEFGSNCQAVPLRTVGPTFRSAQLAWLWWHLPYAVSSRGIDLFHGFGHTLAHVRRCQTVATVHDLMPDTLLSWTPGDPVAVRRRRELVSAVRRAGWICAVSDATKRDVLDVDPRKAGKVAVVPNAVRDTLGEHPSAARCLEVAAKYQLPERFFLTVGADTPRRNYARLIDAMAAAWQSDPSMCPLVLVGESQWPSTRVFRQAAARGAGPHVRFLSNVDDADLSVLYAMAAAYVCPSIHEGFGMPVLEAMACGTDVVCSDLPVLREVAGEAADYFAATSVAAMTDALLAASKRPVTAEARSLELRRLARRFSWNESAGAVSALYDQALSGA